MALAQGGDPGRPGLLAVRLEHGPDGLAVPHLLEDPAREERGDLGVLVGRGEQQVTQVAHGVVLHVVHVAQAPQGGGGQGLVLEVVEVDALEVEAPRSFLVGIDGGSHNTYYSDLGLYPDGPILGERVIERTSADRGGSE